MHKKLIIGLFALAIASLAPVATITLAQDEEEGNFSAPLQATAPLQDAEGNVVGFAFAGEDEEGNVIGAVIQGMPAGEHGIHLHETGNCDPAGEKPFTAAGAHFNPGGGMHGAHAGDLGNLTVTDSAGTYFGANSTLLTLDDGEMGLADADGTALVIHADPDDGVTDPAGNAGTRIACAVLFAPAA
jgi:Cu-Zn family superoxide dismutase